MTPGRMEPGPTPDPGSAGTSTEGGGWEESNSPRGRDAEQEEPRGPLRRAGQVGFPPTLVFFMFLIF